MFDALLFALAAPPSQCTAPNLDDIVVTDPAGRSFPLSSLDMADYPLQTLAPGAGADNTFTLHNTGQIPYDLTFIIEGVHVSAELVDGDHPLTVRAGLSTGQEREFPSPTQGEERQENLGGLAPGEEAQMVVGFELQNSSALSKDGQLQEGAFDMRIGVAQDCENSAPDSTPTPGPEDTPPGDDPTDGADDDHGSDRDSPGDEDSTGDSQDDSARSDDGGHLPRTGAAILPLLLTGLAAVGLGLMLKRSARRRNST